MSQSIQFRTYVAAAFTCLLAASCSDVTDSDTLPDGKYPMTFTAGMQGLTATRATTDGTWSGSEQVAVKVNDVVKAYKATTDGNLSGTNTDNTFYWQHTGSINVSAWYCGDGSAATGGEHATGVTSWTVPSDQNVVGNYERSDFLYAPATSIPFAGPHSLSFYHQTARMVVNIRNAEAATADAMIKSVSICNVTLTGNFTLPTDGQHCGLAAATGDHTQTITPRKLKPNTGVDFGAGGSGNETALASYAALVIPQTVAAGEKFIAITLMDENTYYYKAEESQATLQGGQVYLYNITVKNGYLEVVTASGGAWGDGGMAEEVTGKSLAEGFSASDLKVGDYYYSDGNTSDGGYRKYVDNTTDILNIEPVLTGLDGQPRTVIGIVYWVGDITGDNYGLMKDKFPDGTRGLVVSLWNAEELEDRSESLDMEWTYGSSEFVKDQLANAWTSKPIDYNIQEENKMQGYVNTIALQKYNEYVVGRTEDGEDYGASGKKRIMPIYALANFEKKYPAPENSSGWYWPSVCELKYVCWGQGNSESLKGKGMLNTQIEKVGGTIFGSDYSNGVYWSSTEGSSYSYYAWYVSFSSGYVHYFGYKGNESFRVRPLLAF